MNDDPLHPNADDDVLGISPDALADLESILGDASIWEASDPADEDAIMAAINELAAPGPVAEPEVISLPTTDSSRRADPAATAPVGNVASISTARRWIGPFAAGLAAALALVVGFGALGAGDDRDGIELALDGTDLAPEAAGVVEIVDTPNGTVLLLDVSGLAPAPEGSYYEAWVRQDAATGVSAGTFHLRGGGGEIELWAGVGTEDYPLFTVTIQDEADPVSSGQVVLRGLIGE